MVSLPLNRARLAKVSNVSRNGPSRGGSVWRVPARSRRSSSSALGSRASNQRVERAAHSAAADFQYVCVDHGRCHVGVAEQVLNCADVVSVLQQVRLEAVTQLVKADEGLAPMHVSPLGAPAVMQV